MTTSFPLPVKCPCCGAEFETETWGSTNAFGPLTTDFYQQPAGMRSLPLEVTTCPACGFSGGLIEFVQPEPLPDEVLSAIRQIVVETERELGITASQN